MDIWNQNVARWATDVDEAPSDPVVRRAPERTKVPKYFVGFLGLDYVLQTEGIFWIPVMRRNFTNI